MNFLKKMLFLQLTLIVFSIFVMGQDIHEAAKKGDIATLKMLLERNPELINEKDIYGNASLHFACQGGHKDVVEFLIIKGADLNVKNNDERIPLHFAAGFGHKEVVSLSISKGAKINSKDRHGDTPLYFAAFAGHTDIVRLILSKGADLKSKNKFGDTPLHYAAIAGKSNIIELLIEKGEFVDIQNSDGWTPLHYASSYGRKDTLKLLIAKGAVVMSRDYFGQCPIQRATLRNQTEIVDLLLSSGVEVNAKDPFGDTALHGAAYEGHKETGELLVERGADVNSKNKKGQTPLDNAIRRGHKEIVEFLMSKGAKREVREPEFFQKPLDLNKAETGETTPIKISILYDNYIFLQGTKSDWGFSCLIEGTEKNILFDTGTLPEILLHNVEQLKVDLDKIDKIVISHNHIDHTGGLFAVLEKNRNVSVYLPYSFPYDFVRRVENMKAEVISVKEPTRICKNVFSTGEMGDQIKEQSLIINTSKGLIIVTGCSHQGIVNILKKAKNILDKKIYLVVGGFHLFRESEDEVRNIIREFKEIEVIKCGANHCTGDRAISLFKDAFGENYVQIGTGKILHIK